MDVELGEGYGEAESGDNLAVGVIPVDAVFTPVRKVNFNVEPVHVSREMRRERLEMEVWTDGTITPGDAVSQSAEILVEQLTPFIDYAKISRLEEEKEMIRASISEEKYNMPVEQLDLSVRTMNCLRRGGITTVGELISRGEKGLLALHNFGQKSRQEVEEKLAALDLTLIPSVDKEDEESEEGD
jgi:DNA-directed RNA polymerase subunit alpha